MSLAGYRSNRTRWPIPAASARSYVTAAAATSSMGTPVLSKMTISLSERR
jgi:hypothetical protein